MSKISLNQEQYSNLKAWVPVVGVYFAQLEFFYDNWIKYQMTCIVVSLFILISFLINSL